MFKDLRVGSGRWAVITVYKIVLVLKAFVSDHGAEGSCLAPSPAALPSSASHQAIFTGVAGLSQDHAMQSEETTGKEDCWRAEAVKVQCIKKKGEKMT